MLDIDEIVYNNKIAFYNQYEHSVHQMQRIYGELCSESVYNVLHDFVSDFFINIIDGAKLVMFGNGGSAADCDHIVGEFRNRFWYNRKSINAISLSDSISTLTSIGNDFCFDEIFSRQLDGILNPIDSIIALSTSGKSKNVLLAANFLNRNFPDNNSMIITGMMDNTYIEGFKYHIQIPIECNKYTVARIQEATMFLMHNICWIFDSICESAVDYAVGEITRNVDAVKLIMGDYNS